MNIKNELLIRWHRIVPELILSVFLFRISWIAFIINLAIVVLEVIPVTKFDLWINPKLKQHLLDKEVEKFLKEFDN